MKHLRSHYHALHLLKGAAPKLRKTIILNGDKQLVNSICECVLNVLNGNIELSSCVKRKLRKHKNVLRKVVDKRVPILSKKVIVQRGGFLLPLLSAVLPALATLILE